MRILIVTDAWEPQVNGVVRTLRTIRTELLKLKHEVVLISPDQFASIPCPTYPEIRLALVFARVVARRVETAAPDAIHIATEGPLGIAARAWCLKHRFPFTTAYHTQFPDYVALRTGVPTAWLWRYMRWFHDPAEAVLVSTPTLQRSLHAHGLSRTRLWGRGVDLGYFHPNVPPHPAFAALHRPIQLYVGRVAVEKNVEAFLTSGRRGSKVVVGDGPALAALKSRYAGALFLGTLEGAALASAYAGADVLVFPSRTDTFGMVMLEALACGTPVAAFPVPGPADVLAEGVGALDMNLDLAIGRALECDRSACAAYARRFSWTESARQFVSGLAGPRLSEAA